MFEGILIALENIFTITPLGLLVAFLAGIIASLSPCIYPLIPVTIGIIGAASVSTRKRNFLITLVFVLGIAFVNTTLGIISALFGILLSKVFINPFTYFFLSLIFLFLGLSLWGKIRLKFPVFSFWDKLNSKKGLVSVFLLGAISSLAVIPCTFPVLGAILTLISLKKSIIYGIAALFLFSLGYGSILILVGTFTTLVRRLPQQGKWTIFFKNLTIVILISMGLYFFINFLSLST
jgi:thiol:disulfide interchange protein DsbD